LPDRALASPKGPSGSRQAPNGRGDTCGRHRGARSRKLGPGELHWLVCTGDAEGVRPAAGDRPQAPEGIKARLTPPVEEVVTVGAGFASARSASPKSSTHPRGQLGEETAVVTHRLPAASKTSPTRQVPARRIRFGKPRSPAFPPAERRCLRPAAPIPLPARQPCATLQSVNTCLVWLPVLERPFRGVLVRRHGGATGNGPRDEQRPTLAITL
jgi:hypothetical protein